jgi:hypothetical protein
MLGARFPLAHARNSSCRPPSATHRLPSPYFTASAKKILERSKRAKQTCQADEAPLRGSLACSHTLLFADRLFATLSTHPTRHSPPSFAPAAAEAGARRGGGGGGGGGGGAPAGGG